MLTLGAHMCKWPIGDPSSDDFTFCGRRAGEDGPYCVDHARIAYQPPQGKKKTHGRRADPVAAPVHLTLSLPFMGRVAERSEAGWGWLERQRSPIDWRSSGVRLPHPTASRSALPMKGRES